jgi:hypothetical protein
MDAFSPVDVWHGVLNGVARFHMDVDRLPPPSQLYRFASPADAPREHREAFELALRVIASRKGRDKDWSERGARFFAEILTIAVLSRQRFKEKPLEEEQIFKFIGEADFFLNSWNHTHFPPTKQ